MTVSAPIRVLLAVAFVLLGACQAHRLPESTTELVTADMEPDWTAFTIGPGDLVHVSVFGRPDYSTPEPGVRVGPDGKVGVPLLGPVDLQGLTASEASARIQESLGAYLLEPSVTVSVLEYASKRFFVFGDVQKPGPYPMDRPYTALEGFAMGGGVVPGARLDTVVILRKQGPEQLEVIPFDVETPGPDGLVQLHPDDMIFVSRSGVGVFREQVLPYLQGLGISFSSLASIAIASDAVND